MLEEGALQPVIGLLASKCNESQREAALLLGQFATTEPDYKARIVQVRGRSLPSLPFAINKTRSHPHDAISLVISPITLSHNDGQL